MSVHPDLIWLACGAGSALVVASAFMHYTKWHLQKKLIPKYEAKWRGLFLPSFTGHALLYHKDAQCPHCGLTTIWQKVQFKNNVQVSCDDWFECCKCDKYLTSEDLL